MTSTRRRLTLVSLLVLVGAVSTMVASTASGTARSLTVVKPVIGKATTVPAKPVAGKRLTVSFKVTRSDTGAPLTRGTMMCDPSVTGKVIRHAESFRAGTARLSFVVPANAAGKLLKVRLTIKTGAQSTTRITTLRVQAPVPPSLSIADVSAAEGNAGTTTFSFPVTLSAASTQTVSVGYATADGTATAGSDYTAATGTLTFKPGETSKAVPVAVVADTAVEPDETFTVTLSTPVNAAIADGSATGTITNEDVAPRSGHYAGTTSQSRSIVFDVAADMTSVTNLVFYSDSNCSEVPLTIPNLPLDLTGVSFPLAADWSFGFSQPYADAEGSINVTFNGKLSLPGSAAGTFRIDVALYNIPGVGTVHCSTGDVSWNAS